MDIDTGAVVVDWLLSSAEPAVRMLTRRDLLGENILDTDEVLDGAIVRTLLSGQRRDGGFGVHPYRKWTGAHWRLVSLVELGIPPGEPRAVRAAGTVLDWLTGEEHRASIVAVGGRARVHASPDPRPASGKGRVRECTLAVASHQDELSRSDNRRGC